MPIRRYLSVASVCLVLLGVAGPAAAQTCLLGFLCGPQAPTAPAPQLPPPPPPPALPAPDSVTQPVTDTVDSVQQAPKPSVPALEEQMLTLINADRALAGVPALQVSGWAQSFARHFSQKMMAAGTIWHNPEYFARGRSAMGADLLSENVGYDSSIPANHLGFMKSPSHRVNILDGRLTHVGIGVAVSPSGTVYVTEDFARIPGSRVPRQSGPAAPAESHPRGRNAAPVDLALANKAGMEAGQVETLNLSAPDSKQASAGSTLKDTRRPESAAAPQTSQSPAPMVPGLITGGVVALLAPLIVLAKKLLLLLTS